VAVHHGVDRLTVLQRPRDRDVAGRRDQHAFQAVLLEARSRDWAGLSLLCGPASAPSAPDSARAGGPAVLRASVALFDSGLLLRLMGSLHSVGRISDGLTVGRSDGPGNPIARAAWCRPAPSPLLRGAATARCPSEPAADRASGRAGGCAAAGAQGGVRDVGTELRSLGTARRHQPAERRSNGRSADSQPAGPDQRD
jgi:hypothetical protein